MINITQHTYVTTNKNTLLPIYITYQTLTKNELINCHNRATIEDKFQQHFYKYSIIHTSVLEQDRHYIELLSEEDYNKLYEFILEKSKVKDDLPSILENLFTIYMDKNLQNDTWDCENCKARCLQLSRNCPLIEESTDDFVYTIKGKVFKSCPIGGTLEHQQTYNEATYSYSLYKKGLLPNKGGLFDQTDFFILSSRVIDNLVNKYEQEELEKMSNK